MNRDLPDPMFDPSDAPGEELPPSNRRRAPRFKPREAQSLLGDVLDLSATGMRVLHEGRLLVEVGETFDILLQHEGEDVMAPVRVVWIEPLNEGRHAIGLEFTRSSPELERHILAMRSQQNEAGASRLRAYLMGP